MTTLAELKAEVARGERRDRPRRPRHAVVRQRQRRRPGRRRAGHQAERRALRLTDRGRHGRGVTRRRANGRRLPPAVDRHARPPGCSTGSWPGSAGSCTPTRPPRPHGPGRRPIPCSARPTPTTFAARSRYTADAAGRGRRRLRMGDRARGDRGASPGRPDGRGFARGPGRVSRSVRLGTISGGRRRGGHRPRGDRTAGAPDARDRGVDDGDRGPAADPASRSEARPGRPTTGSRRPRRTGRTHRAAATRHAPRPIGPPEPSVLRLQPGGRARPWRGAEPTRSPARPWSESPPWACAGSDRHWLVEADRGRCRRYPHRPGRRVRPASWERAAVRGRRVTVDPWMPCGRCEPCRTGVQHLCGRDAVRRSAPDRRGPAGVRGVARGGDPCRASSIDDVAAA